MLWSEKVRRVSVSVQSDVAVTITLEDEKGVLKLSPQRLEHAVEFEGDKPGRVKIIARNASGTRKARGSFSVTAR